MSHSQSHRIAGFFFAAFLTLATLGGIDQLATQPAHGDAAQWAQQQQQHIAAPRA